MIISFTAYHLYIGTENGDDNYYYTWIYLKYISCKKVM